MPNWTWTVGKCVAKCQKCIAHQSITANQLIFAINFSLTLFRCAAAGWVAACDAHALEAWSMINNYNNNYYRKWSFVKLLTHHERVCVCVSRANRLNTLLRIERYKNWRKNEGNTRLRWKCNADNRSQINKKRRCCVKIFVCMKIWQFWWASRMHDTARRGAKKRAESRNHWAHASSDRQFHLFIYLFFFLRPSFFEYVCIYVLYIYTGQYKISMITFFV